jgi:hypothetical protein
MATTEDYILIIIDPFTTLFYTLCLLTILQIIFERVGQEILYMQILEGRTEVKTTCQKSDQVQCLETSLIPFQLILSPFTTEVGNEALHNVGFTGFILVIS